MSRQERRNAVARKAGSKKKSAIPGRLARPKPLSELPAWDSSSGHLHVVVDTPKGSGIKFKFDLEKGCYTIAHILPPGAVFPFDFGSIPSTSAADGDPLDALILMEEPSFAGCLVPVRLIGVLEAKQTQDGKTNRNDRLIGVAAESRVYRDLHALENVPKHLLEEIEHFFVSYNEERGRAFRVLGRFGPARAARLVRAGERQFQKKNKS
jgi:inorganic pyrophosphatase